MSEKTDKRTGVKDLRDALLSEVKYVLLDMDGTLLDKYFDDYFWETLVPEKYAEIHNITFEEAKKELLARYKRHEGTLNWTDIDFWSEELNLDIPALKEQIRHLIEVHPNVEEFLSLLKEAGKHVFLVTNAHYKTLTIKLKKTRLGVYFDRVITSFDMNAPKEELIFWERAEKTLGFEREKTMFIDDIAEILSIAEEFGIKYVVLKRRSNSRRGDDSDDEERFLAIDDFRELLPASPA
jgi:putative hydrolase of the HAD superfamily